MRIIPCIDIYRGKVVRLTSGDFTKVKEYVTNPVEQATIFKDNGLEFLHIVDLEASKSGVFSQINIVRQIIRKTNLKVNVGGGIRTTETIASLIDLGVEDVNIGTMSVLEPDTVFTWGSKFGFDRIVPSFDCVDGQLCIHGWEQKTTNTVNIAFESYIRGGFQRFSVTDVLRDGTLTGINRSFFENLKIQFPDIQLIAGGGVSSLHDLENLALINLFGVVLGKAIYENKIPINKQKEISYALQKNNSLS